MHVIGTAGHVDHGKSTLIEALTGIHPDRLKEEREREMTIDLGFAWLTLLNGEEIGIIDVPGHRDFIENMLAGVGGIDAALFVIAADEGIMPQTREHLAILDLLQIQRGVVALTKIDLIDDPGWLELVEEDIHKILMDTVLADSPIVRVSARSRVGLDHLLSALTDCLAGLSARIDYGRPRLPIDRVFTIAGFGTVVTGTLSDGSLQIGDEIEVLPRGIHGRVRGLQMHRRKEEMAIPGSRTAVNIAGISVEQIKRGDTIVHPGDYKVTHRMDVRFRLLPDTSHMLKHNTEVKLYIGSAEVLARVRLLGIEELRPGEQGWLQLELNESVVALAKDRYILRLPSPGETLGGGIIVDAFPGARHKRFSQETLERLESLAEGTPDEVLVTWLDRLGVCTYQELLARSELEQGEALQAIARLVAQRTVIFLEANQEKLKDINSDELIASHGFWEQVSNKFLTELKHFHQEYPLRQGMPREALKSRLKLAQRVFSALNLKLVQEGVVVDLGGRVALADYQVRFSPQQEKLVQLLLQRFTAAPYTPPSIKECQVELGEEIYNALVDLGKLVPVSHEVVFSSDTYQSMVVQVQELIHKNGSVSAAQVRDHFNTSRKYVLALLEHLDAIGITVREGDVRRLKG